MYSVYFRINASDQITGSVSQVRTTGVSMLWLEQMIAALPLQNGQVDQQQGEEFKGYKIWQRLMARLHSTEQQKRKKDGDTENGCQKPALQQKTANNYDLYYVVDS